MVLAASTVDGWLISSFVFALFAIFVCVLTFVNGMRRASQTKYQTAIVICISCVVLSGFYATKAYFGVALYWSVFCSSLWMMCAISSLVLFKYTLATLEREAADELRI